MRYLFIFQIGEKDKYCCCKLKSGLITMAVLAIIFAAINFTMSNGLYSLIFNGVGLLLPILVLIPVCTYKPTLIKVATIIYTIYLYLMTILCIVVTIVLAEDYLDTKTIVHIVDMWLYLLFLFFALYAFTSFTCNYDLVMGVATGQTIHVNKTGHTAMNQIEVKSNMMNQYDTGLKNEDVEKPEKQEKS